VKKIIIAGLCLLIIGVFLVWKFAPAGVTPLGPQKVTLTYWGLWEDDNLIKPVIAQYQKLHPEVTINYVRQSSINYRTRVQTQIRAGTGPDIFMLHNTWVPMFSFDLAPAPTGIFNLADYQKTFYPIAVDSLVKNNQILAASTEVDGLALYYNEEILNGVGVSPPRNWQDFANSAVKMTVIDSNGTVKTAGAAMGNTSNVDHWPDILGLLLLQQPGIDLNSPTPNISTSSVAEVLRFYTGFVIDPKKKTWDSSMPKSTDAFAQGRLAFYFAPSWEAFTIRQINPNLKFKVVPVPQLSGKNVSFASFWATGVSGSSKFQKESWEFIKYLTSQDAEKLSYSTASQVRLFGEPYSRVDLGPELSSDPIVGAFVNQGLFYKSWYLASNTFDLGLNDEMIKYWEDGINSTLAGQDPQIALQTVEAGARQVLEKYTKPQVAPAK